MPAIHRSPRPGHEPSGTGMAAAGIGAALVLIICCAGPALIAAGALGAIGGFLGNPWMIAAAVLVLVTAVTAVVRRRRLGRDACCPPGKRARSRLAGTPSRSTGKAPALVDGRPAPNAGTTPGHPPRLPYITQTACGHAPAAGDRAG